MTAKNESNCQALVLANQRLSNVHASASQSLELRARRNFLVSSMAGATGLALTPIDRVLGLPTSFNALEYALIQEVQQPQRKRGFWATFLGVLDLAASLFGFGGIIPAITNLVKCVANNKQRVANDAFTSALGAMRSVGFPLNIINRPRSAFSEIGIRLVSSLLQSLPCATGQIHSRRLFAQAKAHHLMLPPASDLRFLTPALRADNLNGVTVHFDYTDATNPRDFDPKGVISAPTTHALIQARSAFEGFGYRGESFRDFVLVPTAQRETERALGRYGVNYKRSDIYKTKEGATFEINYHHSNESAGEGTGVGDITYCGLVDKSASNKRMGLKRIRYSLTYPPCDPQSEREHETADLTYQKGFTEFRP